MKNPQCLNLCTREKWAHEDHQGLVKTKKKKTAHNQGMVPRNWQIIREDKPNLPDQHGHHTSVSLQMSKCWPTPPCHISDCSCYLIVGAVNWLTAISIILFIDKIFAIFGILSAKKTDIRPPDNRSHVHYHVFIVQVLTWSLWGLSIWKVWHICCLMQLNCRSGAIANELGWIIAFYTINKELYHACNDHELESKKLTYARLKRNSEILSLQHLI